MLEFFDQSLAAQIRNRLFAVQPDVLKLVFFHTVLYMTDVKRKNAFFRIGASIFLLLEAVEMWICAMPYFSRTHLRNEYLEHTLEY